MIIILYIIMFYCFIGAARAFMDIRAVTLAQHNLRHIEFLIKNEAITDVQYRVYMNEFELNGYKDHRAMVELHRELGEAYDKWNTTNRVLGVQDMDEV